MQCFLRADEAFFFSPGHYRCLPLSQYDAFCLSRVRKFEGLKSFLGASGFQDEILGHKAASWRCIKAGLGGQTYLLSFNVQSYLCAMSPAGLHKDQQLPALQDFFYVT